MKKVFVLQHVPHEPLGSIERHLSDAGVEWREIELFNSSFADRPWAWDDIAGLVVLGGPMNVDDVSEHPFLQQEPAWIREATKRELPLLGICLGSQLLAKSLGARVFSNAVKEIGWYEVEVIAPDGDPLFNGFRGRHTVFQWHGDTFDLPAGAVHLARGERCENQAFRYGERAYGLQFHVEVTFDIIESWLDEPKNRKELEALSYIDPAAIRERAQSELLEMEELGRPILSRFAELCRQAL